MLTYALTLPHYFPGPFAQSNIAPFELSFHKYLYFPSFYARLTISFCDFWRQTDQMYLREKSWPPSLARHPPIPLASISIRIIFPCHVCFIFGRSDHRSQFFFWFWFLTSQREVRLYLQKFDLTGHLLSEAWAIRKKMYCSFPS